MVDSSFRTLIIIAAIASVSLYGRHINVAMVTHHAWVESAPVNMLIPSLPVFIMFGLITIEQDIARLCCVIVWMQFNYYIVCL